MSHVTATPVALMSGARCERIVLERGSVLEIRLADQAVLVRITDLTVGDQGEICADLEQRSRPMRDINYE
jgi:hypothetical protein